MKLLKCRFEKGELKLRYFEIKSPQEIERYYNQILRDLKIQKLNYAERSENDTRKE
jgi:hypothetical protein